MAVKRRAEFRSTCTSTVEDVAVMKFSAATSLGIPSTKVSSHDVAHTRRHGADSRLIERFLLLVCALTHVVFDVFHFSSPSLRTQTRPAMEFVSGEEGLRPKSYFTVLSFVEYVFTVIQKYAMAPGPSCGAEGDGGTAPLAAGAPRVQLRTWYAAWVEWVASERKKLAEENVSSAGGDTVALLDRSVFLCVCLVRVSLRTLCMPATFGRSRVAEAGGPCVHYHIRQLPLN